MTETTGTHRVDMRKQHKSHGHMRLCAGGLRRSECRVHVRRAVRLEGQVEVGRNE